MSLENQIIALNEIPRNWPNYEILKARYPEGLSHWGLTILGVQHSVSSGAIDLTTTYPTSEITYWDSYFIDNIYEYERLASFTHMPSRLQSIFGSETLEEAREWKGLFNEKEAKIYEIEFDDSQCAKLEAHYLSGRINNFELHTMQVNAKHYWSGHTRADQSKEELVIKLPVRLVKIVE